jgi:Zn-dependent protease/predicted transcriptional regulator
MWGRSVRIARIGGFAFKVDASWLLIANLVLWSLATSYFPTQVPDARPRTYLALAFVGLAGLFASILLHELAHAIVARAHGMHDVGVRLYLFGGVTERGAELPTPRTEIWIAVAGPIVSLGLALALWFCARLIGDGGGLRLGAAVFSFLSAFNLLLGLGNLLPAFPLDGGRILRAVLWIRSGDLVGATLWATRLSAVFSIFLSVLGLVAVFSGDVAAGFWPILIGILLLSTAQGSSDGVQAAAALDGRTVGDLMSRNPITVRPNQSLSELVSQVFLDHGVSFAPVVEDGDVLGYIDIHMAQRIDRENWTTTVVDDVIECVSDENCVSPDMPGRELLGRIGRTGRRKFLVVVGTALVGVITLTDLVSYLSVAKELQQGAA